MNIASDVSFPGIYVGRGCLAERGGSVNIACACLHRALYPVRFLEVCTLNNNPDFKNNNFIYFFIEINEMPRYRPTVYYIP